MQPGLFVEVEIHEYACRQMSIYLEKFDEDAEDDIRVFWCLICPDSRLAFVMRINSWCARRCEFIQSRPCCKTGLKFCFARARSLLRAGSSSAAVPQATLLTVPFEIIRRPITPMSQLGEHTQQSTATCLKNARPKNCGEHSHLKKQ